jgi:hypothetical protein
MKTRFKASYLILTFAVKFSFAQSAAYLETISLTFQWNLSNTSTLSTTTNNDVVDNSEGLARPVPAGFLDPSKINPLARITTHIGRPLVYVPPNPTVYGGNQNFFARQILQTLNRFNVPSISKETYDGKWEITAVREPQSTVLAVANQPYSFWLTRIEPTSGRPQRMFKIPQYGSYVDVEEGAFFGMSVVVGDFIGNYTEEYTGSGDVAKLNVVKGNLTIPFTISFGSVLFDDFPDTFLKRNIWQLYATGTISMALKSNKGASKIVVVPNTTTMTAVGAFTHTYEDLSPKAPPAVTYGGIGPVKIIGGTPKYQNRQFLVSIGYF